MSSNRDEEQNESNKSDLLLIDSIRSFQTLTFITLWTILHLHFFSNQIFSKNYRKEKYTVVVVHSLMVVRKAEISFGLYLLKLL